MELGEARIVELNRRGHIDDRLAEHFSYYFQPQFSLENAKLKGFECLLRMHHPTVGVLTPGRFIDQINEMSIWNRLWPVMLSKIAREQKKHGPSLKLAINVSPVELEKSKDSIFIQYLYKMAKSGELDASGIEVEITEDFKIDDFENVNRSIYMLNQLGTSVVIDDFGAGFCNLSALDRLDVLGVKIDRGLIDGIESSETKQTIVKSLVEIAKVKGCYVLAEGIETGCQRDMAASLGCEFGQGFLLGRPSPSFVHKIQF